MNKMHSCTHLREEGRSVHLLKIEDFCVTKATIANDKDHIKLRCCVDGHDCWEIHLYPSSYHIGDTYLASLVLVFLGGPRMDSATASISARLVEYRSSDLWPSLSDSKPFFFRFKHPLDRSSQLYILSGTARDVQAPCLVTVEVSITVTRDLLPAPNLDQHLGELLRSTDGADVMFAVGGESFPAHKSILAARSPVFKAEFFGEMEETTSRRVEIKDMDADVFGAMLGFIYTDNVPQLLVHKNKEEATDDQGTVSMAQHLLVAADRYGLDRLKAICERRLSLGIDVGTVALTLALAERHGCSRLKADCINFIARGSPENLHAVLATEGYRHLEASSPWVLTELLKAAKP